MVQSVGVQPGTRERTKRFVEVGERVCHIMRTRHSEEREGSYEGFEFAYE